MWTTSCVLVCKCYWSTPYLTTWICSQFLNENSSDAFVKCFCPVIVTTQFCWRLWKYRWWKETFMWLSTCLCHTFRSNAHFSFRRHNKRHLSQIVQSRAITGALAKDNKGTYRFPRVPNTLVTHRFVKLLFQGKQLTVCCRIIFSDITSISWQNPQWIWLNS